MQAAIGPVTISNAVSFSEMFCFVLPLHFYVFEYFTAML